MEALPGDLFLRVSNYVGAKDICRLEAASRALRRELRANASLWASVLAATHGGLVVEGSGRRALVELSGCRRWRPLTFQGSMTDGGVDDELERPMEVERHWVDSLFRRERWRVYSSTETREAVVCCGALDEDAPFDDEPSAETESEVVERWFMLSRLRVAAWVAGELGGDQHEGAAGYLATEDEGIFSSAFANEPPDVVRAAFCDVVRTFDERGALSMLGHDTPVASRPDLIDRMRRLCAKLEHQENNNIENGADDGDSVGRSGNDRPAHGRPRSLALETRRLGSSRTVTLDASKVRNVAGFGTTTTTTTTAIVTRVSFRRPPSYSCPAARGVVFGSLRAFEVEDLADTGPLRRAVEAYRAAMREQVETIREAFDHPPRGRVVQTIMSLEGTIFEIEPDETTDYFFPVAAFVFTPLETLRAQATAAVFGSESLACCLKRRRALRGIAVALLDPEDRMRECNDDHAVPNVDMDLAAFDGYCYEPRSDGPLPGLGAPGLLNRASSSSSSSSSIASPS